MTRSPTAIAAALVATETTLEAMREIMTTACQCSMDAMSAYRVHMAGDGPGAAGYGPADRPRATAE